MNTIVGPPQKARYGPPQSPGIHAEADGFTAVCACKWLRWSSDRSALDAAVLAHEKKCKGGDK